MSRYSSKYAKLTSLEALFDWFVDNGRPYWSLYRTFLGEKKLPSYMISQNNQVSDMTRSWEMLEKNIEMQSLQGGEFTVYVSEKERGNYGCTTFLELANPMLPVSAQVSGLPAQNQNNIAAVVNGGVQGYITEQISAAKKELMMQNQIDKLKKEVDYLSNREPDTLKEKLLEPFLQDPFGVLDKCIQLVSVYRNNGPTAVKQVAGGPPVTDKETTGPAGEMTQEIYTQRLAAARERIQPHIDILILLENIADVIDANPAKVPAMLHDKEKFITLAKLM